MNSDSDDNWLNAARIECPTCSAALFRVNHSPYCDDWRLYCDSCPIAIEVSFYDGHVDDLRKQFPDHSDLFDAIARDLVPCNCGGSFQYAAARRCFACKSVVVTDAGVDLSPFTGCELLEEYRDPTEAEQAIYDEYEAQFLIPTAKWR